MGMENFFGLMEDIIKEILKMIKNKYLNRIITKKKYIIMIMIRYIFNYFSF